MRPSSPGNAHALATLLADGEFHSGEKLAGHLGITRAAVWKQVRQLAALGLEVCSVPGRGYRLARPLELLDSARIRHRLSPACRRRLQALSVLDTVDSTNQWLLSQPGRYPAVCLAEMQSSGRGRRGRTWVSPFAANMYLSMGWQFDDVPPGFSALGMVAAIAAVRALRTSGVGDVGIKWPNDLLVRGEKLGGILVDAQGEPPNRMRAVIGIGINVHMPESAAAKIDQPWTDLASQREPPPERNLLAAALVEELMQVLQNFATQGFSVFDKEWRALDLAAGKQVQLQYQQQVICGKAEGVDQDGALLLHTESGLHRFISGDLSMRIQS